MTCNGEKISQISEFYSETSIFITGATGFLGKLLLEKLLRSCCDVKCIYLLLRPKKGKSIEKRFQELWKSVIYEGLKETHPKCEQKIILINGDCGLPNLGLNDEDREMLINNVNCVFHCAATVRFDEHIRTAVYTNVRSTQDLLLLAKKMQNLKSFVHVSTAYSNCVRNNIKEQFYSSPYTTKNILSLVEKTSREALTFKTPKIIGEWPNTYTLTKAIAEGFVKDEAAGLPITVVRPSIILGSNREPLSGWLDNVNGFPGIVAGIAVGLIHVILGHKETVLDFIPADFVVNCIISAGWKISTDNSNGRNNDDSVPIYNCVSSTHNPVTLGVILKNLKELRPIAASKSSVWYPFGFMISNYYLYLFVVFILHDVPAFITDTCLYLIGKPKIMQKQYAKIHKMLDVLSYFMTNVWKFEDTNTQFLWKSLSEIDQEKFYFDPKTINWDDYIKANAIGTGLYILKDTYETMPEALKRQEKLKILHYALVFIVLFVIYKLFEILLRHVI